MTGEDIDTALRAQSPRIGFDSINRGLIKDPPTEYCNVDACASYARMGTDAGATADDVALALLDLLDGERGPMDALMQAAKDARTP